MKDNVLTKGLISPISCEMLYKQLKKQLDNFFLIDDKEFNFLIATQYIVLQNLRICIEGVDNKYYKKDCLPYFNSYHSGQYLTFLYITSNTCYKEGHTVLSEKVYYLNKIMHACDIYPAVQLPNVFFLEHPVGTVLGRAKYGENFFAMQGCTVGGNKGMYPTIGSNVKMYSNSKVLGNSIIGNNVSLASNTYIKDTNIPDNTIVFGQYPNLILKTTNDNK